MRGRLAKSYKFPPPDVTPQFFLRSFGARLICTSRERYFSLRASHKMVLLDPYGWGYWALPSPNGAGEQLAWSISAWTVHMPSTNSNAQTPLGPMPRRHSRGSGSCAGKRRLGARRRQLNPPHSHRLYERRINFEVAADVATSWWAPGQSPSGLTTALNKYTLQEATPPHIRRPPRRRSSSTSASQNRFRQKCEIEGIERSNSCIYS